MTGPGLCVVFLQVPRYWTNPVPCESVGVVKFMVLHVVNG